MSRFFTVRHECDVVAAKRKHANTFDVDTPQKRMEGKNEQEIYFERDFKSKDRQNVSGMGTSKEG